MICGQGGGGHVRRLRDESGTTSERKQHEVPCRHQQNDRERDNSHEDDKKRATATGTVARLAKAIVIVLMVCAVHGNDSRTRRCAT